MSQERENDRAPMIVSPGAQGWPDEPKVTAPERLLYGDLAPVVRLLGQAAVAAQDAYSLACKFRSEAFTDEGERAFDPIVQDTWEVFHRALRTHREVAARATEYLQVIAGQNERAMTEPLPEATAA